MFLAYFSQYLKLVILVLLILIIFVHNKVLSVDFYRYVLLVFRSISNTIIPICVLFLSKMCLFCEIYKEKIKKAFYEAV